MEEEKTEELTVVPRGIALTKATFEERIPVDFGKTEPVPESTRLDYRINVKTTFLGPNRFQTWLTVEASPVPTAVFDVLVTITGIFEVTSQSSEKPERLARYIAPAVLYPYVRQTIAALTLQSRFGPVHLPIINISAALQQQFQQETAASAEKSEG